MNMTLIEMKRQGEYIKDTAYAMATQVYVRDNLPLRGTILLPYMTKPFVQIGRYQNAMEEVNLPYLKENKIGIVRRDTGGGTVYLDEGEINVCFLDDSDNLDALSQFNLMYEPVLAIMREMGVENIEKNGRNDLEVEGKKVSGAALTITNGRAYGGFTLLFDVNWEHMTQVLRPNAKKMASKSIKSVRSRVGNLRDYVGAAYKDWTSEQFLEYLLVKMTGAKDYDSIPKYELTEADWAAIDRSVEEKYGNWDWIFGAAPRFSYNRDHHFKGGTVDISLDIEHSRIAQCKIYGDFFGSRPIEELEAALVGCPLREEDLTLRLEAVPLAEYMAGLTAADLVALILDQKLPQN